MVLAKAIEPFTGPMLPMTVTFLTTTFNVAASAVVPAQQPEAHLAVLMSE